MTIGSRIARLRTDMQLSQYALAEQLGVSRQAVSKWEKGYSVPDAMNLIRLAEVLDTDIEYLTNGRQSFGRRPPVVVKTTETVERVVEKPVVVEKVIDNYVEVPVVEYVEKPVVKKITRVKYLRNPIEFLLVGFCGFLLGLLAGWLIL